MNRYIILLLASIILLATTTGTLRADEDKHEHAHAQATAIPQLQLNDGQKWQTDEALRVAMKQIRETMAENLDRIHDGTVDAGEYGSMANDVDAQVQYMLRNCKLPPAADAELHKLVGMLARGARTMQQGENPQSGAITIVQALQLYDVYFEHDGW